MECDIVVVFVFVIVKCDIVVLLVFVSVECDIVVWVCICYCGV